MHKPIQVSKRMLCEEAWGEIFRLVTQKHTHDSLYTVPPVAGMLGVLIMLGRVEGKGAEPGQCPDQEASIGCVSRN